MFACVIGATGLVGRELVQQLLIDPDFELVTVFGRRELGISHPKLTEERVDFEQIAEWGDHILGDVLFSCLGTTLKQAGSKAAQYQVDYWYQMHAARHAKENRVKHCVLVSAPGASPNSKLFYNRMKGELDRDVAKLDFSRLTILKPSILDGHRETKRVGEILGLYVMKSIGWIPGFKKYRPIHGRVVARAMIAAAKQPADFPIVQYKLDELFGLT